ncbi:MAG TPA: Asp/Glu racemase, partial [Thermoanaerobacterales bacterium]|nr:Asp/Glu racemase [Thermoanaerobacterales bacterium]
TIIYCNSLSSAIDTKEIQEKRPETFFVTPLDVYQMLANNYNNIVLWAANAQSLAGIEKVFYKHNPSIKILGISMLPVVKAIEESWSPHNIIEKFNLLSIGTKIPEVEALVLGCTHFPYLKENLSIPFEIIDPSEKMLETILKC